MSDMIVKRLVTIIPSEHQAFVGKVSITVGENGFKNLLNLLNSDEYLLSLEENENNIKIFGTFFLEDEKQKITLGTLPKAISLKIIKYTLFEHIKIYLSCYRIIDMQEIEMEFEISIDKNVYNNISEQLADDNKNTELEKKAEVMRKLEYCDEEFSNENITQATKYQKRLLRYYDIELPRKTTKIEAQNIIEKQIGTNDIEKYMFLENLYENLNFNRSYHEIKKVSQMKFFSIINKLKWKKDLFSINEDDIVDLLDANDFKNNDSW